VPLLPAILALFLTADLTAAAGFEGTRVDSGISVRLSVDGRGAKELREGDSARVTVALTDKATGAALRGIYPAAWLGAIPEGGIAERERCVASVAGYLSGGLFKRAELDVNTYYVVTMNADPTLTVVDPRFSFGGSRLLALVQLRGAGHDWASSADGERLFVAMPSAGEVAVVDTASWQVVANIAVGAHPRRALLQPGGAHVWIAYDGGVAALDPRSGAVVARLATPKGAQDLAASDDGRYLFTADGTSLAIIDTRVLQIKKEVPLDEAPVSIAWSSLGRMAYVAGAGGAISVIDPVAGRVRTSIAAGAGIRQLRMAPGGRHLFVVNPAKDLVQIVDTASNRVIQNGAIDGGPFEVTFSEQLAYVRRMRSDVVLMIPLADLGTAGRPIPVVDFPAGQEVFGDPGVPADGIVSAPGESAVLVSHPKDGKVYYYREGMAAPVGHFVNYGKIPRAVLVIDRTLREQSPGVFSTVARLPHAGTYNLAVFVDSPRVVACFEVSVKADPVEEAARAKLPKAEPLTGTDVVAAGSPVPVAFRVTESGTGRPIDGLTDADVLVYQVAGGWNERRPLQNKGDGRYETNVNLPAEGVYYVYIESPSAGLRGSSSTYLILQAASRREGAAGPEEKRLDTMPPPPPSAAPAGPAGGADSTAPAPAGPVSGHLLQ
jgi:YVTN family beta-propeller protein